MAEGCLDTLKLLGVDCSEIQVFSFYTQEGASEKEVTAWIESLPKEEEIVVFTDLLFGSVNQLFIRVVNQYPQRPIRLISGMSLPVIMAVSMSADPLPDTKLKELVAEGRGQLQYMDVHSLATLSSKKDETVFE